MTLSNPGNFSLCAYFFRFPSFLESITHWRQWKEDIREEKKESFVLNVINKKKCTVNQSLRELENLLLRKQIRNFVSKHFNAMKNIIKMVKKSGN